MRRCIFHPTRRSARSTWQLRVQVLAYETRAAAGAAAADAEPGFREQAASHEQMESFLPSSATPWTRSISTRAAHRNQRCCAPVPAQEPSEQEVRLLRGILADTQRTARLAQAGNKDS